MFDADAIRALTEAESITAASNALTRSLIDAPPIPVVALPEEFKLHNVEQYLDHRIRARGRMDTQSIDHFAQYVLAHMERGAMVFVNADDMKAVAVLNLGVPAEPGHADNLAVYSAEKMASYSSLLAMSCTGHTASGVGELTQRSLAEWIEDWDALIKCTRDGIEMKNAQAVAAVRAITIESARKDESVIGSLSAERTAFESVKAETKDGQMIPDRIEFKCVPFKGFEERVFSSRLSVIPKDKSVALKLRVAAFEKHKEEMADELAAKMRAAVECPVFVGSYRATV